MKTKFIFQTTLIVLLAITIQNTKAQSGPAKEQTLLYRISGIGLKAESYIILTTVNTCADLNLTKKTSAVLSKVQAVAFETGLSNPNNEAEMQKLIIVKNESGTAKKILSKGLYTQLVDEAGKVGLNEVKLNTLHPIYIVGLSIKVVNPCQLQGVKTTEQLLRAYAQSNKVKVEDLTSAQENFDIFNSYPNSYWEKTLDLLVNQSSSVVEELDNKTDFYKHENLRGVCAVINKSNLLKIRYTYPEIELKKINLITSRVENQIKRESTLIQLDISDVANPSTSIFEKLTKSGYVISPILN